jgi:hypothetical protein
MKIRTYTSFLFLSLFLAIQAQDSVEESEDSRENQAIEASHEETRITSELKRDSETLAEFVSEFRSLRELDSDSMAQKSVKRNKLRKLLITANKSNSQKRLDLYATKVLSADRYQNLTQRGMAEYTKWLGALKQQPDWNVYSELVAQKQLFKKILLDEFWRNYHERCPDCFLNGKKYILRYTISNMYTMRDGIILEQEGGDRHRLTVLIIREISNEDEFISARINSFQAISGNISELFYCGAKPETLILYIE